MAKERITPCLYYICKGECEKNREASMHGYCQKCDKYKPRAREHHINKKKQKLAQIRDKEMY